MEGWSAFIPAVLLLCVFLLVLNFHSKWEDRRVNRKLQFAERLGLSFIGEGLPADFPADFLNALPALSERRDAIAGWYHGEFVLAFEFDRNVGRSENWNSVVAVRQLHPTSFRGKPPLGCMAARYGEWSVVYSNTLLGRRLPLKTIAKLWDGMRTSSEAEAEDLQSRHAVTPGMIIRPRSSSLNL